MNLSTRVTALQVPALHHHAVFPNASLIIQLLSCSREVLQGAAQHLCAVFVSIIIPVEAASFQITLEPTPSSFTSPAVSA